MSQFDSPDPMMKTSSLESHGSVSKQDFLSRESSVKKIIDEHIVESNLSPTKATEMSRISNQMDFKAVLRQKLIQLKQSTNVNLIRD